MVKQKINAKLKGLIVTHFITQGAFSKKVDESPSDISKTLRGVFELSDKSKKRWAKLLKCAPADIFPGG